MKHKLTPEEARRIKQRKQSQAEANKVYDAAQREFLKAYKRHDPTLVLCECRNPLSWGKWTFWHCYCPMTSQVDYAVAHEIAYGCYPVSLWQEADS